MTVPFAPHRILSGLFLLLTAALPASGADITSEFKVMLGQDLPSLLPSDSESAASCTPGNPSELETRLMGCSESGSDTSPSQVMLSPENFEHARRTAKLSLLNEKMMIALQPEESLRSDILRQADQMETLALKQSPPMEELRLIARELRSRSRQPRLKETLMRELDVLGELEPARIDEPSWKWRKSDRRDLIGTSTLSGLALTSQFLMKGTSGRWTSENRVDEGVRNFLRGDTEQSRKNWRTSSDILVYSMIAYSLADPFLASDRWEIRKEASYINLESFAFTAAMYTVMRDLVARKRPPDIQCDANGCRDVAEFASFPSGHVAFAFTAAGLLCTHHSYSMTWGNKAVDQGACLASLLAAAAVGVGRMGGDKHYFTDVSVGAAIGLISGFVLPRYLHYKWENEPVKSGKKTSGISEASITPAVMGDRSSAPGLMCVVKWK